MTPEALGVAPIDAVIARVKQVYSGWSRTTTAVQMRHDWDGLFAASAVPAAVVPVVAGSVPAAWIAAPGVRQDKVVVYFHGGGFQVGSLRSHRELMSSISAGVGCRVLGVDYRLAPEHRFPAPLQDARAAYEWLLMEGVRAADIALAGDSAGGGLVISAMVALRDAGRPLPAAAVLMSPWTDLTASGESYTTRADADPIHQRPMILGLARHYLGANGDADDPSASPLFADLRGLPPLLIQVGDRETLLSDATVCADRARAAGVAVDLEVWEQMIHVFQQFPADLIEARRALASIGRFLRSRLGLPDAPSSDR